MKTLRASFFQSHVSDIDQNKNSAFFCCTGIGAGCSTKKTISSFFRRKHFRKNYENTICVYFQFS